jgi:hypothetical protein
MGFNGFQSLTRFAHILGEGFMVSTLSFHRVLRLFKPILLRLLPRVGLLQGEVFEFLDDGRHHVIVHFEDGLGQDLYVQSNYVQGQLYAFIAESFTLSLQKAGRHD